MFVWEVEVKKESVAPLLAPSLFNMLPIGITPQEQKGNGIPANVAHSTELKFGFAICPIYFSLGTYTFRIPAIKNPKGR
jgi:hypothetical protein